MNAERDDARPRFAPRKIAKGVLLVLALMVLAGAILTVVLAFVAQQIIAGH